MSPTNVNALLVIVFGLPGAGKSTFAQALAAQLDITHLNTDQIRFQLGLSGRYDKESKEKVYGEVYASARSFLEQGRGVIVDGTFYKKLLRNKFKALALEMGCPLYWIEIRANAQTIEYRVNQPRPFSEANFPVYEMIRNNFEPLEDEPCLALWSDILTLEEMVAEAKQFIIPSPAN
ncbi:MAG: ATP-binding protein [Haliscomenobacter sp.]|nr:ATP-binding protein [Haliscomenobacter sp.]